MRKYEPAKTLVSQYLERIAGVKRTRISGTGALTTWFEVGLKFKMLVYLPVTLFTIEFPFMMPVPWVELVEVEPMLIALPIRMRLRSGNKD